jgi:lipopolysaccharide export LptBFGC system permease protein LptF
MLTIHRYLLAQILVVLSVALAVFVAVLLLGNAFKEVLLLLVNRQVSLGTVAEILLLQIPWLLSFALPLGFLAAVLLVFGRLSADQELTALRAGGISLTAATWPVILLALACCLASFAINTRFAPDCRIRSKAVAGRLIQSPADLIVPGRYIRDFPGWTIYINERNGERLERVLLYGHNAETGRLEQRVEAERGMVNVVSNATALALQLEAATFYFRSADAGEVEIDAATGWETLRVGRTTQSIPVSEFRSREIVPDLSEMTRSQLREELKRVRDEGAAAGPVLFHLHRQQASSFACLAFALVGLPLGIRAHRRETSVGLALALVVAIAYYAFLAFAQSLETKSAAYPHLLVWLPDFLFVGLGGWLTWRANRGLT